MKKEQEIQQLTERFLEGATSNAEEQTLYDYFAGEEVAESLKPYREMFRWYAAGMPQNRTESRKTPRRLLAAAASLLLLLAVGNFVLRKTAVQEDNGWDYVSYLAQSLDPDGLVELKEAEEPSDEDIRSFLLASNISVEQLAMLDDEKTY